MMNYAFFGTSDKSLPILEILKPSLCITKTDTKVGRRQETRETAVKQWAKKNGVDYLCIDNIRDSEAAIINKMREHNIELGVVADFSYMLTEKIISEAAYGLVNIHFSLLPTLRGASPVQHTILLGLELTGVTYYLMDSGMDTGDILDQVAYPLVGNETAGELYSTLFDLAAQELPRVINDYVAGRISPQKQDEKDATYCYSETNPESTLIDKNDAKINWQEPVEKIERLVRAYNPWPIAWTTLGDLQSTAKLAEDLTLKEGIDLSTRVKLFDAELIQKDFKRVKINRLQVAGKNETDWNSFVNGYAAQ